MWDDDDEKTLLLTNDNTDSDESSLSTDDCMLSSQRHIVNLICQRHKRLQSLDMDPNKRQEKKICELENRVNVLESQLRMVNMQLSAQKEHFLTREKHWRNFYEEELDTMEDYYMKTTLALVRSDTGHQNYEQTTTTNKGVQTAKMQQSHKSNQTVTLTPSTKEILLEHEDEAEKIIGADNLIGLSTQIDSLKARLKNMGGFSSNRLENQHVQQSNNAMISASDSTSTYQKKRSRRCKSKWKLLQTNDQGDKVQKAVQEKQMKPTAVKKHIPKPIPSANREVGHSERKEPVNEKPKEEGWRVVTKRRPRVQCGSSVVLSNCSSSISQSGAISRQLSWNDRHHKNEPARVWSPRSYTTRRTPSKSSHIRGSRMP